VNTQRDSTEAVLGPLEPDPARVTARSRFRLHDNVVGPPREAHPRYTRLREYFERTSDSRPAAVALECDGERLSYADLDQRANRFAHFLSARGVAVGVRVGILLDRSVDTYVALLAITKLDATFVPIDPAAPADRLEFIAEDASLGLLVTGTAFATACAGLPCPTVDVDTLGAELARQPSRRPDVGDSDDPVCYIIYTSGSSGRPKGVAIAQSSICNFIGIVPSLYGVEPSDRVYQGMTIAFDFSIEEIWPTWAVGATLVAGPTDGRRVGPGLADFLEQQRITMIYCVPTVLATLDRTLPLIRTVNVGGEACPRELVDRWGPGRRILNTYGPTETTVTCTMAELRPGRPVTIGRPLPSYRISLLDDARRPVPEGEVGEICVGGPGVAIGYLNRPELTEDRFIPDPEGVEGERIYRTGDLGRLTADGEIEYLGRADSEVKVRGHRVDLQEIESSMLEHPQVTAAVVNLLTPETGELAGYVILRDASSGDEIIGELHERLVERLPGYMVPAYLDVVTDIPMLPSGKADRKNLPEPSRPRLIRGSLKHVPPATPTEEWIARVWGKALNLPPGAVSVEADLFDVFGGHSLLAATIVSALRESDQGAGLSILDLYSHPTVRSLAAFVEAGVVTERNSGPPAERAPRPAPPSRGRVVAVGSFQAGWLYAILVLFLLPVSVLYGVNDGIPSLALLRQLMIALPLTYLVLRWLLPLAGTRLLSRGLRPGTHPLWGRVHLQVWTVQKLMTLSPLNVLSGSPFAATYLRLAGARIGDECHIGTADVPIPAFLSMGRGATVGYGAQLRAFRIAEGVLTIDAVTVGRGAVVGSQSVVEPGAELGEGAILREQALLESGQHVPPGQTWSGSPARPAPHMIDPVIELMAVCHAAPRTWSRTLRAGFVGGILVLDLLPLVIMLPVVAVVWAVLLAYGTAAGLLATALSGPLFVATACAVILGGRRLALSATPPGIHHLRSQLGLEKWLGDKLLELSLLLNNTMYATLYTPIWLRALGTKVGRGAEVSTIAHLDPDLLTLGDGSFVADMASVGSATYANGHVAFRSTEVGSRAFIGNASFIPSGTYLGDGSLIGVQSVPPPAGVDTGASWLGSPPFYLPRREVYDQFTEAQTFTPSRGRVRARYAVEALRIVLPSSLLGVAMFTTLYGISIIAAAWGTLPTLALAPLVALTSSVAVVVFVALLKWIVVGRYRRRIEPLWSGFVRRTEFVTGIYEAAAVPALLTFLTGTPLLGPMLRLFGAKIGRRALIDTTYLTEFDLVHVGDDVSVGTNASLQTHLFEDRVMKMSHVTIRNRASVGSKSVVLYDTVVGADATLASLSLVMKGETLPPGSTWAGIPAQAVHRATAPPAANVRLPATRLPSDVEER
jgi:non-ribosomal peptide synthetase-like protein